MARFFVIACLSAFVAMCSSSAILAGSSGRGAGGVPSITDCKGSLITLNAADCVVAENNEIVAGILGGAVLLTCNQQCTNNSTCYDFSLLSSRNSPVVSSKGNQRPEDSYRCCTTEGTGNNVNCGGQKCTATSAGGSNSEAKCCTYCSDGRLISALPTH